ncbi:MAG TPA: nucleoside deaminase [Chondromyces sp.]|nr:nucleoside deaminase [Chondromyces sp.]
MDKFMERAVELAVENVQNGGQPFGAVLVRSNEAIAEGVNELHKAYDISGHAELLAIRRAQEQLQTNDLSDCIMYASGEPCAMCLTAMYFAGIKKVYYSASVEDAADAGLEKSQFIYKELQKKRTERTLSMIRVPIEENKENPMKLWKERI